MLTFLNASWIAERDFDEVNPGRDEVMKKRSKVQQPAAGRDTQIKKRKMAAASLEEKV